MTVSKSVPSIIRQWWGFPLLTALILTTVAIPNVLEATELTSAREQQKSTSVKVDPNQTGAKHDLTVDGDARAGKGLFEKHCVICHGARGKGDGLEIVGAEVADLTSATTQRKLGMDLLKTIHEGRPDKVMPSWKWRLSEQQAKDVLAYVRTLRK
jgi:mono/diheme cytochrome c family protein